MLPPYSPIEPHDFSASLTSEPPSSCSLEMPTCKVACSFKIPGPRPSHSLLTADTVCHILKHFLRFTFYVLIATPWLDFIWESRAHVKKLYLQQRGWCYRHQWRSATVQSWMDNSGSCAVLGSCLWKESHAAGITDRSCSHGGLLYWWDTSSSLLFGWPRGHQVHTTGSTCHTQYGGVTVLHTVGSRVVLESIRVSLEDPVTSSECFGWGTITMMYSTALIPMTASLATAFLSHELQTVQELYSRKSQETKGWGFSNLTFEVKKRLSC